MGIYSGYADTPDRITAEGSSITLTFVRATDGMSGLLSWNIPGPIAGCDETQRAYNGLLITGSTQQTRVADRPVDGQQYVGDPSMGAIHIGSKIGVTNVVLALYNNKTTDNVVITGLDPSKVYYFTLHAVDSILHYHAAGVSSYSLPDNIENVTEALPAVARVQYPPDVTANTSTNYRAGTIYKFSFLVNGKLLEFDLIGDVIQTFGDLVRELNVKFATSTNPTISSSAPLTGTLYYNPATGTLFRWDGAQFVPQPAIVTQNTAPNIVADGAYWYNPTTNVAQRRIAEAWVTQSTPIVYGTDPATPACDDVWLNGIDAKVWNGYSWVIKPLYTGSDPGLRPMLTCRNYWLNDLGQLLQWQDNTCAVPTSWMEVQAIRYDMDPNSIVDGVYWLKGNELFVRDTGVWVSVELIVRNTAPTPVPGDFWYNPVTKKLTQRNTLNSQWVEVDYVASLTDPTIRASGDLWLTSTNILSIWDASSSTWVLITEFATGRDPSLIPLLAIGSIWNTSGNKIKVWDGSIWCPEKSAIVYPTDPTMLSNGTLWFDTTNNQLKIRTSGTWTNTAAILSQTDPTMPATGSYWYSPSTQTLSIWNGMAWVPVTYGTNPMLFVTGAYWLNPTTGVLSMWSGSAWVPVAYELTAALAPPYLTFTTRMLGSDAVVRIVPGSTWLDSIPAGNVLDPALGQDEVPGTPSYDTVGVGTDGTADDRRKMTEKIRFQLGWPGVDLELTNAQYDLAIEQALQELRMKSGSALRKDFFFLRIKPGQTAYTLSNKTAGLNKIVHIIKITRQRNGFYSTYDNSVFADAQIQRMFQTGVSDLVSFEAMAGHSELIQKMFATSVMFTWNERTRLLKIMQALRSHEVMLLECAVERTEQELMNDRYLQNWIQDYARAECMMMIGEIRSKFASLPGPGGGVTLNGDAMLQRATELKAELVMELESFQADNPDEWLGGIVWG